MSIPKYNEEIVVTKTCVELLYAANEQDKSLLKTLAKAGYHTKSLIDATNATLRCVSCRFC